MPREGFGWEWGEILRACDRKIAHRCSSQTLTPAPPPAVGGFLDGVTRIGSLLLTEFFQRGACANS
eukprot:4443983-Pleurochrysis_carterae.AAC.3